MTIQMIEIKIGGNSIIEPNELPKLINKIAQLFSAQGNEPIIISGRLPVWAYAALTHWFHPRPWVATFEPRENKGVVVASHKADIKVGELVNLDTVKKTIVTYP